MSISSYERALEKYEDESELLAIMARCARDGLILCDHDVFVCALYAMVDARKGTVEILSQKELDKANGYYVCIGAGSMKKAMELCSYAEFIAYHRFDHKLRIVRWERLWEVSLREFTKKHHRQASFTKR